MVNLTDEINAQLAAQVELECEAREWSTEGDCLAVFSDSDQNYYVMFSYAEPHAPQLIRLSRAAAMTMFDMVREHWDRDGKSIRTRYEKEQSPRHSS